MHQRNTIRLTLAITTAALLVFTPFSMLMAAPDDVSLFPPNAEPGKCYAKVLIPAKYKTVSEEVVKREASEKIEIVPAKWEMVEEKVLVKEAEEKLEIIPATYKVVEEKVVIEPASAQLRAIDAVYGTVEEKIVDKPARTVWKKGSGLLDKLDNSTGDIMCLINEPETYKTVQKQIIKTPAAIQKVDVPEKTQIIKKKVIDKPAETKKITIPAEYMTVKVKKLVAPAQEQRAAIPKETQMVTKLVKESDEKMAWQPVLCETNMTKEVITKIQKALQDRGFDPGRIDGSVGSGMLRALEGFQQKNNLAKGGLTYETLKALNISMN